MKKTTSKKNQNAKKTAATSKGVIATSAKPGFNPWSLSIYIYWFIILFFIASTFYILGRSHNILRTAPNNVEITEEALLQATDYLNSGKTKLLAGNIDEAITDLTAAIDADADSLDSYILRGEAYMQSGNYDAALADFNAVIEKDDANSVAYYDRALLNTRLENYSAALNDINAALAARTANPNNILQMRDLYAKRGQLNLWLKNWEGAVADYTKSLTLPDGIVSPTVYAERAEAFTALGNLNQAIADYTTAVRVISEQIQGTHTAEERETLSANAMDYYEKSAALNVKLGNLTSAHSDLESAFTIAAALNNEDTMNRLQRLLAELDAQINPPAPAVAEVVAEEVTVAEPEPQPEPVAEEVIVAEPEPEPEPVTEPEVEVVSEEIEQ